MPRYSLAWLLFVLVLWSPGASGAGVKMATYQRLLTRNIPPRAKSALSGSQFAATITKVDSRQREEAILRELLHGNLPAFLRKLVPVRLHQEISTGRSITATIFVMPDYLSIGSNKDFLRIPMDLYTATTVAERFGFILPTRKMVDCIYAQSPCHFKPIPMTPGPQMRSTAYYRIHNQKIHQQRLTLGVPLTTLVSGHKKDLVVTNRLAARPDRVAIYGWHRCEGEPIQPLSTVHGAFYADYSHGVRLVSDLVLINGKLRSIYKVLEDPLLANVLSDEGSIHNIEELIPPPPQLLARLPSDLARK